MSKRKREIGSVPTKTITTKNSFVLTSISLSDIIKDHFEGVTTKKNTTNKSHDNITDFIEDVPEVDISFISNRSENFLDTKKIKRKLWPIMIDCAEDCIIPTRVDKPCRNCHHKYETRPLGCPVEYYPHKDDDTVERTRIKNFLKKNNFSTDKTDFFETEGLFCSFPCVKSYIMTCLSLYPLSSKYMNALSYLTILYKKLLGGSGNIPSALPLETLKCYGGHLNIDEYRSNAGVLTFDQAVTTKRPLMFARTSFLEEFSVTNKG